MISLKSGFRFWKRNFKDTLVLIPGWATDYRIFANLDLNYNYLLTTGINLSRFKKDLLQVLDRMSLDRVSLLGWSLGGFLAADFAGQYPDRIDTLILLSICKRYEMDTLKNVSQGIKKNKKAYLYKFYLNCFSDTDQECLNWFKKHLLRAYLGEMHLENLIAGLKFLSKARINPESLARIKRIRVFHGSADKIAPLRGVYFIKSKLSQVEFICLKGLGHIPFLNPQFKEKFYCG